jgi:hypothetical protein
VITTDDLKEFKHVVIIETATSLRMVEFDEGQMEAAHDFATSHAGLEGFSGRIIVACRVRQLGDFDYLNTRNLP